jgi:hypothetical protein
MVKQVIAVFVFLCGTWAIAAEPAVSAQESEKRVSLLSNTGPFSFEFGLTNIYRKICEAV